MESTLPKTALISVSFPISTTSSAHVAIWKNDQEKTGGHFRTHSCTVQRRYRDSNEWKSTQSFRASDLLMISFAAREAYHRLMEEKQKS